MNTNFSLKISELKQITNKEDFEKNSILTEMKMSCH